MGVGRNVPIAGCPVKSDPNHVGARFIGRRTVFFVREKPGGIRKRPTAAAASIQV